MQIEIPPGIERDLPLQLEDVDRKTARPPQAPKVSLGQPVVVRLTKKLLQNDRDAVAALTQSSAHVFDVVRLACTFRPADGEKFTEAWLQILCKPETAIAWSMLPHREADFDEGSSKITVGAGVKLLGAELKAGGEESKSTKRVRPFIDAMNLQQSDPQWRFKATNSRDLEGSFPMALVLRSEAAAPCSATLRFRCVVQTKRFGVFTYMSDGSLPDLRFAVHK